MELKPGARLRSTVCATEVIIVRPPSTHVELSCGGQPMVPLDADVPSGGALDPARSAGTQLGKRYADEALGIEVLCTKAGEGSLSVDGALLGQKDAKPLPSSD